MIDHWPLPGEPMREVCVSSVGGDHAAHSELEPEPVLGWKTGDAGAGAGG